MLFYFLYVVLQTLFVVYKLKIRYLKGVIKTIFIGIPLIIVLAIFAPVVSVIAFAIILDDYRIRKENAKYLKG